MVDLAAAEHLDDQGRLVPLGQHAGLRYVCDGSDRERSSPSTWSAPATSTPRCGAPGGGPVPAIGVSIQDRHRPRPAGASFECSDPVLERIHEVGLRTVDLCALDAYVDCPTREQRAWTGDSVVHQMVDLVANPDWSMATWHPRLAAIARADGMLAMAAASDFAADDRTFVPDWSLHWVRSLHNLYRYTGDRELVAELVPVGRARPALVRALPRRPGAAAGRQRVGAARLGQRVRLGVLLDAQRACGRGLSRTSRR